MQRRREIFEGMGVEFRPETEVGRDVTFADLPASSIWSSSGSAPKVHEGRLCQRRGAGVCRRPALPHLQQRQSLAGLLRRRKPITSTSPASR